MTLASEVEAIGGLLKKYYESDAAKEQFWADFKLIKRLKKNRRDIFGGTATVGLHVGRNPAVAAAANGAPTPAAGKQTYNQTTIPLRYVYGATQFTGPDIANSRTNKAAFASVMTGNMTGLLDDMQADINRQLFADGSGILAFATSTDGTTTVPIAPYLWGPANKYLQTTGTRIEMYDISDGSTSNATSSYVTTPTGDSTLDITSGSVGTSGAGDAIGKYGALQLANGTAFTQYELMGLSGIIHDTDLLGDASYAYDTTNSVTNFTGPEGQNYDWTGPTSAANTNTLQNLSDANAWWKAKVMGNGGVPRSISYKLLDDMIGHLRTTKGSKLSAIFTTYQVVNKLIELMRVDRRYPDKMTIDGGMEVNAYAGIPIITENDCPRGQMLFVDESELSMYIAEDFGFIEDGRGNNLFKITGYDGYEVTSKIYANLGAHNRNKHGKIIDLLES